MRIGYITCIIYNTPDNLRIALEDNLIENSKTLRFVLTFYRQATDRLPTHYQQSAHCRPTVGRQVANISGKTCRPSVGQLSADRFFGELFFTVTVLIHATNHRDKDFITNFHLHWINSAV